MTDAGGSSFPATPVAPGQGRRPRLVAGLVVALVVGSFAVAGRRGGRANLSLGVTTTVVLAIGFATSEFGAKGLCELPVAATVLIHADREGER